jgi:uridine kinase
MDMERRAIVMAVYTLIIQLSGGDCSGKKVLMKFIINDLTKKNVKVTILQQESFYIEKSTSKCSLLVTQRREIVSHPLPILKIQIGRRSSVH